MAKMMAGISAFALTAAVSLAMVLSLSTALLDCSPAWAAESAAQSHDATVAKTPVAAHDSMADERAAHTYAHVGKVSCKNAHAACHESEKVIETLQQMAHLYSEGKFDEYAKYMDDQVTTFDERKNTLIEGKSAVLANMKERWQQAHADGRAIVTYTINHPYAQVHGDQAVVTFEAVKTVGGKNPETMVSRCTDIFVKRDGGWKKMHYRSCWKKGKSSAGT